MNDRSDLDRVLRHWFDDGPSTMPDRVVDVVADRIASQRQRPAWRLLWRPFDMNTTLKLGAAIAAVLVIAVIGWNLLPGRQDASVGGPVASPNPTSTPLVSPTPTASATAWWLASTSGPCGEAPLPYGCAGALSSGVHTSGGFQPAITYTVPDGWVNVRDWADYFSIFPDTPATRADMGSGHDASIDILVRAIHDAVSGCAETPAPGSWDAVRIVEAFAARDPGRPTPSRVTIGGMSGQQVDLTYTPDLPLPCPETPAPPLTGDGGRYRLVVLDRSPDPINVVVRAVHSTDFDALLADAMPIIESFEFEATPSAS